MIDQENHASSVPSASASSQINLSQSQFLWIGVDALLVSFIVDYILHRSWLESSTIYLLISLLTGIAVMAGSAKLYRVPGKVLAKTIFIIGLSALVGQFFSFLDEVMYVSGTVLFVMFAMFLIGILVLVKKVYGITWGKTFMLLAIFALGIAVFGLIALPLLLGEKPVIMDAPTTCTLNGQVVECPQFFVAIAPFMSFIFPIFMAPFMLMIAGMWKMFTKANQPGWASIVPIYNLVVMLQIVGKPIWWIFLTFIPFVNVIIWLILMRELAKFFGKGIGFTFGLILLPMVFFPILGFGKSKYMPPAMQPVKVY